MNDRRSKLTTQTELSGYSSRQRGSPGKQLAFMFDMWDLMSRYGIDKIDAETIFYAVKEILCPYFQNAYNYPGAMYDLLYIFTDSDGLEEPDRLIGPAKKILSMIEGELDHRTPIHAGIVKYPGDTLVLRFHV